MTTRMAMDLNIPKTLDACKAIFCDTCIYYDEHRKTVLDCIKYQELQNKIEGRKYGTK